LLRRRADRLSPSAIARLDAALSAGDPDCEVSVAWWCAQQVTLGYASMDLAAARRHAEQTIDTLLDCPVPESAGLVARSPCGARNTLPPSTPTAPAMDRPRP
jgi:transposase